MNLRGVQVQVSESSWPEFKPQQCCLLPWNRAASPLPSMHREHHFRTSVRNGDNSGTMPIPQQTTTMALMTPHVMTTRVALSPSWVAQQSKGHLGLQTLASQCVNTHTHACMGTHIHTHKHAHTWLGVPTLSSLPASATAQREK